MITFIPFKNSVNTALLKQPVGLLNSFSDRCHNRVACFFLFVSKAEINHIGFDVVFFHIIRKTRKPNRWRSRLRSLHNHNP